MPELSVVLLLVGWAVLVVFFRVYRVWVPYYVVGSVGLAWAAIFLSRDALPLDEWTRIATVASLQWATSWLGIATSSFSGSPGALIVPAAGDGWSVIHVDAECSGLLESSVLMSLLAFYPGWSLPARVGWIVTGILATYAANIVRLSIIVSMLYWGGMDTLLVSHTIAGRAVFFALVVLIYWTALTRPTLRRIARAMERERRGA